MLYDNRKNNYRKSFTLIELLVVLALVAILSVVVILTLNPAELIKQARDSNRLSDLSTINTALNLFSADVTSGFMGTSTVVYVSLPDNASSTCGSLGLPALPSGYIYNCVTAANLRNTNGTGWIPVNFQSISSNSPISQLPIDPQNTTSTKYYTYVTGGSWKLTATPESEKYTATAGTDGGTSIGQFEVGNNMSLAPFVDGLVGWWKFDEESGTTTVDSSGWGNSGTVSGATVVAGKVGNARSFNGVDQCVSVPNIASFDYSRGSTLAIWVNQIQNGGIYMSFSLPYLGWNSPTYSINVSGNQKSLGGAAYFSGWNHVVGTYNGNDQKIYLNGALISSQNVPGVEVFMLGALSIGAHAPCGLGGAYYFGGQLDDVRIYNRAFSVAEVLALYNATK